MFFNLIVENVVKKWINVQLIHDELAKEKNLYICGEF